jgi:hypothetical protein
MAHESTDWDARAVMVESMTTPVNEDTLVSWLLPPVILAVKRLSAVTVVVAGPMVVAVLFPLLVMCTSVTLPSSAIQLLESLSHSVQAGKITCRRR